MFIIWKFGEQKKISTTQCWKEKKNTIILIYRFFCFINRDHINHTTL